MRGAATVIEQIGRLAAYERAGAIVVAEQAIDTHAARFRDGSERRAGLDILSRELGRLRATNPAFERFVGQVENYVGLLRV